jgi:hypothetical protein
MRKVTSLLAGAFALWATSAAPASAVLVRFDIEEISDLRAAEAFDLVVAEFEGFLIFEFVDTDEDGMVDRGTLIDSQLFALGPVQDNGDLRFEDVNPMDGIPDPLLFFELLPGDVNLTQIPDGTDFQYIDPFSIEEPPPLAEATAADPVGTLMPSLETPGLDVFTFDPGERLSVEGAPDSGLESCTGSLCAAALNLIELPLDLSGPQAPLEVDAADQDGPKVFFDIIGLHDVETTPATMTGAFEFFLGTAVLEFEILSSTGMVVPEPGAGLGIVASIGTLALLGRRRRA